MSSVDLIRNTSRVSGYLFRNAFPLYAALYGGYKRLAERRQITLMRRLVRSGDRVVDVGANVGFYARLLGHRVGPQGAVIAFEPDGQNFARLRMAVRRMPWVLPVEAGVTDHDGTITLYQSADLNVDHRTYATDEVRRCLEVRAVTLDEFFSAGETLQFVKMDVQGGEYPALLGMREVVARSPDIAILLEIWPYVHERFGAGTRALLALLESWGFAVHRLTSQGTLGEALTVATWRDPGDPHAFFDVLCVRPGGRG